MSHQRTLKDLLLRLRTLCTAILCCRCLDSTKVPTALDTVPLCAAHKRLPAAAVAAAEAALAAALATLGRHAIAVADHVDGGGLALALVPEHLERAGLTWGRGINNSMRYCTERTVERTITQ